MEGSAADLQVGADLNGRLVLAVLEESPKLLQTVQRTSRNISTSYEETVRARNIDRYI
jgi:hypothetical protein